MTESAPKEDNEARTKLLSVATKLFAMHGFEGVSTRDLAKESGLNISLISYYFGGKEGLYREVILSFGKRAQDNFYEISDRHSAKELTRESFSAEMKELIQVIIRTKLESPDIEQLLQREMLSGMPHARDLFDNVFQKLAEAIVLKIKAAQSKKVFRQDIHPYVFFMILVHSIDSFMMASNCRVHMMEKCFRFPQESNKYVDEIFKILFEGNLL